MKKTDFNVTIQTVANIGVVAGIVFLAFELHQNNDNIQLQERIALQQFAVNVESLLITNSDLRAATIKAQSAEELSLEERILATTYFRQAFRIAEWRFLYFPDSRERLLEEIRPLGEDAGAIRGAWDTIRSQLDPEFVRFIERNRAE